MTIDSITIRGIFDSRGEETIAVDAICGGNRGSAHIPSGKSRGAREASVFPLAEARASARLVCDGMRGKEFRSVGDVDSFLISYDPSAAKTKIGGNVALGISIAAARAFATAQKREVWELIREEQFRGTKDSFPLIFSNFINGGAHARTTLDIQEYMVVAKTDRNMATRVAALIALYREVGEELRRSRKLTNIPIGDEGGYALDFEDNFAPLALLQKKLKERPEAGWWLALDAAATGFSGKNSYRFEGTMLTRDGLAARYADYAARLPSLMSFEDPFGENDEEGFLLLRRLLPAAWVVGDDLTTTNEAEILAHAGKKAVNAVIIKPNQIGTVSESCHAIHAARRFGAKVIVSHRSGETEDAFIIHLAKAAGADGVKIGAPVRERLLKFNELIRLFG